METRSDECVSNFLADLLEIGGLYKVDRNTPDKFIRNQVTGEVERVTNETKSSPLAIYGTYNPDALIINPFSEGESTSVQATWFFSKMNCCLAMNILAMVTKLLQLGIAEAPAPKKKTSSKTTIQDITTDSTLDLKLVNLLSPVVKDIDEKMLTELKLISKPVSNFFTLYFNKKTGCSEATSILVSEVKKKQFDSKSVRSKTWTVLETLLLGILGTKDDLSEFIYKPVTSTCRVFEGFSHLLVKIYSRLNEYSQLLIGKTFDTCELESHLTYFEKYAKLASWCHGPMIFDDQKATTTTPLTQMTTPMPVPANPIYNPMNPMQPIPVNPMQPMPMNPMQPTMQPVSMVGYASPMPMQPINQMYNPQPQPADGLVADNPFSKI